MLVWKAGTSQPKRGFFSQGGQGDGDSQGGSEARRQDFLRPVHLGPPWEAPQHFGKEKRGYVGGTLFVDHASGFTFIQSQVSLTAAETLDGKRAFERYADEFNIKLKSFRVDNHPFGSDEFRADCLLKTQHLDFSGVGAKFQNGCAERSIKTCISWARSMLLHSMLCWPEESEAALWPFALEHAVHMWNHMPHYEHGFTPVELFTQARLPSYKKVINAQVWGCPVYVLDPKIQD